MTNNKETEERLERVERDVEHIKERIRPKEARTRGDPIVKLNE